jgi:hypothetical protein
MIRSLERWLALSMLVLLVLPTFGGVPVRAQANSVTFPQTGKTVQGIFLQYWTNHGALDQQGYPISDEMQEVSSTDGKTYTVQYFERAVFELHPENQPPYDVLLSLLGSEMYGQKYPNPAGAPGQVPNTTSGSVVFPSTGKRVGGRFLDYWNSHGGLAQQGYPISEEFSEVSDTDGKTYTVQYFERAVFEYHAENQPPYDVLLSLLGTMAYKAKTGGGAQPSPIVQPTPPSAQPTATVSSGQDCSDVPSGQDMTIQPTCGQQGTKFDQVGHGFNPGENVGVYVTYPNQSVHGVSGQGAADETGTVSGWYFTSTANSALGIYAVTMEGVQSHHKAIGYFKIILPSANAPGCDNIPASQNMTVTPNCGPVGTTFALSATGFQPGELVGRYYTSPTGEVLPGRSQSTASAGGTVSGITYTPSSSTPPGIWAATYEGVQSHRKAIGYFKVTAP